MKEMTRDWWATLRKQERERVWAWLRDPENLPPATWDAGLLDYAFMEMPCLARLVPVGVKAHAT